MCGEKGWGEGGHAWQREGMHDRGCVAKGVCMAKGGVSGKGGCVW